MAKRILPEIFTYWLEKSGKDDKDLALVLGINKANIPPWKSGVRPIPEHHNAKIANFLGCDIGDLVGDSEDSVLRSAIVKRVMKMRGIDLSNVLKYLQEHDPDIAKTQPPPDTKDSIGQAA